MDLVSGMFAEAAGGFVDAEVAEPISTEAGIELRIGDLIESVFPAGFSTFKSSGATCRGMVGLTKKLSYI